MNAVQLPAVEPEILVKPAWREDIAIALLLGVAGAFAAAALMPYMQLLTPEKLAGAMAKLHISFATLVALQSVQAFVLLSLLSLLGLRLGHRPGLGAPWLRALLFHRPRVAQPWLLALASGLAAGLVVLAIDPLFAQFMPRSLHALPAASANSHAFAGFLASFYGGIVEEIELRLVLVTLLAWALAKLNRGSSLRWHRVFAVVIAALAFGALHLPTAAAIWPLDAVVITRTVLLNGIAGLVFGWFYVRHGLESAMLSHFCADLVLHVAAPLMLA